MDAQFVRKFTVKFRMKWLLPLLLGSVNVNAALSVAQMQEARTLCDDSLAACAEKIDSYLAQAKEESAFWYELKLLKFNALYLLQQDEALLAETSKLVLKSELPAYFRATLYIYHAKELLYTGNKLQGQHYLDKTTELLEHLTQASRSPLTEVRLVNVQMLVDQNRPQAYERLKALDIRFDKSGDYLMKFELYNNLGHVSYFLDKRDEAVLYRHKCLEAAMKTHNTQFQAEAHYNLARQRTRFGDFSKDINQYFLKSMELNAKIDDDLMVEQARLFLSELLWMQGDHAGAQAMFDQMNAAMIPDYNAQHLQRIRQLIGR
jgi:hypothetical protein